MAVYTRPSKRRLPKRSRTRPVYGKGDDKGRYFRCWNCGFICDKERDELGDADSDAGDNHTDYHNITPIDPYTSKSEQRALYLRDHNHILMKRFLTDGYSENLYDYLVDDEGNYLVDDESNYYGDFVVTRGTDEEGELVTITHGYTTNVTRGCPFCGCTNWMGKY